MYKMIVIDDEYYIKEGIKNTIDWNSYNIEIVGFANNGEEGLILSREVLPDIILTDIRMPIIDGIEFMKILRKEGVNSHIIVISAYDDFEYAKSAIKFGADNYILKPIDNNELIETVLGAIEKIENEQLLINKYHQIKNDEPIIKKQVIRDIIVGNISDIHKIKENLKIYNLHIKDNFLVITIRIKKYKDLILNLSLNEINKLKSNLEECIIKNLISYTSLGGLFIDKDEDEYVIILNIDLNEFDFDILKQRCSNFISVLTKKYINFPVNISIGISEIHNSIDEINIAYKEAFVATNNYILPELNTIIKINDKEYFGVKKEVIEALNYIKENYEKDISIEDIANFLHISPSYLMHLFKDGLKKTFNDCLTEYRIYKAKELLKDTKYKIYEISEKVGYKDPKYFSQIFKRFTGKTPKEYSNIADEGE